MVDATPDMNLPEPPRMFRLQEDGGVNDSERLLSRLCRRSFLRLWAYSNLFTDEGRRDVRSSSTEFCDALVVFGDDVLIFSDKQIKFNDAKPLDVAWPRWYRKAVNESIKQLWGARSWLTRFPDRVFLDAACEHRLPFPLPTPDRARYHLIAVTRGTRDAAKLHFGDDLGSLIISTDVPAADFAAHPFVIGRQDSSRGFIHVLDEVALEIVMEELDTITDFLAYINRREALLGHPDVGVHAPGEEALVATYLTTMDPSDEHCFVNFDPAAPPNLIAFSDAAYRGLQSNPAYIEKKRLDDDSRFWDELIDRFITHADPLANPEGVPARPEDVEPALRYMAAEPRFRRRMLTSVLRDMMLATPAGAGRTRLFGLEEQRDPSYVLMVTSKPEDETYDDYREHRRLRLFAYCQAAKLRLRGSNIFVGLAFDNPHDNAPGVTEDLLLWEQRVWNEEIEADIQRRAAEVNILGPNVQVSRFSMQEFPDQPAAAPARAEIAEIFAGLNARTTATVGKRPKDKKKRDKVVAKSKRANRRKKRWMTGTCRSADCQR